jgi:hypothetical protein
MALFGSVVNEVLQQEGKAKEEEREREEAKEMKEMKEASPFAMASPPSYTSRAFSLHSIGSTHVPLETYLRAPPAGNAAGAGGGGGVGGFVGVEGENSNPLFYSNNSRVRGDGGGGGGVGGMDPVLVAENLALERGAKSLTVGSGRSATGERIRALANELLNA